MNCSEEDKLMIRPRLYPGTASVLPGVQSGYRAASLPFPSSSRQRPSFEGKDDSIYVLPIHPHKSQWHHLSMGKLESGERSDWLPRWQMGTKYLAFPYTDLLSFSCKSLLQCWRQGQLYVCCYVLGEAKKLVFKAFFDPGPTWVICVWCLCFLLIFAQCFAIYNFWIQDAFDPCHESMGHSDPHFACKEARDLINCPRSQH